MGEWRAVASWVGDDDHLGAESQVLSMLVKEKAAEGGGGVSGYPSPSILIGLSIGVIVIFVMKIRKNVGVKSINVRATNLGRQILLCSSRAQ